MKVTQIKCDNCGMIDQHCRTFQVDTDRKPDGAGGMETIVQEIDLCPSCISTILKNILKGYSCQSGMNFLKDYRKIS
jgi:hypothetical protein